MAKESNSPEARRVSLQKRLKEKSLLRFPGAFSPLIAKLIERHGFEGVYCSGAVISNQLGFPDIGLTTLSEVSRFGAEVSAAVTLPVIIDADTGFGDTANVGRTIAELEASGVSGCHIEDQVHPKRCGHLDNKELIPTTEMERKVQAAARSRRDSNFLIIARTDARAPEGLEKAIERAKRYVDAGADAIFPEALQSEKEFEQFRKAVPVPMLVNMTEFGKSPLLSVKTLESLGVDIVIYPVTLLRLALGAVERGLSTIIKDGTQQRSVPEMYTRDELYALLGYDEYKKFDEKLLNFKSKD